MSPVKMEILLLCHPKLQEVFKRTFLKTIKIKNKICFSWVFNISQSLLFNAKERFTLAPAVSELKGSISLAFYLKKYSSNHDNTVITSKLITERNEKQHVWLWNDIWGPIRPIFPLIPIFLKNPLFCSLFQLLFLFYLYFIEM